MNYLKFLFLIAIFSFQILTHANALERFTLCKGEHRGIAFETKIISNLDSENIVIKLISKSTEIPEILVYRGQFQGNFSESIYMGQIPNNESRIHIKIDNDLCNSDSPVVCPAKITATNLWGEDLINKTVFCEKP